MPTDLNDLSKDIKRKLSEIMDSIKGLDVDRETVKLLKETEDGLDILSDTIEKKRREMEDGGVERTVRKDAAKVLESVNKAINDIKKDLDPDQN